ncbi:MAG: VOC family protein [candidate division Zixibacteria bacterium]|nr:VOC family protein [candidate division Zixibacteria bacterium]
MSNFLCHFEILTSDLKKAKSFYTQLFNWEMSPWGAQGTYETIKTSQEPFGGLGKTQEGKGVLIYFKVDDIEQTLNKVKQLGGKVIQEKSEIPNVGFYGIFSDTDGNQIALFNEK